jgi:hypothetical protein
MYVLVRKTSSVLDRNLIFFIITPPATTQLTSFFLAAHIIHPPLLALVDCGVVEVGDWVVRFN